MSVARPEQHSFCEDRRNLQCYHCSKVFRTKSLLDNHLQYVNSYRMHECPISGCNSAFSRKSHLSAHLAVHNGTRKHACEFPGCGYRARTASQLAQHQATHGLGYIYACNYCDYLATTSSNLRRHTRLHLNNRPFICPHCGSQFVELGALRLHVLDSAHHPGLPLYVCPWCTQSPSRSTSSSSLASCSIVKGEQREVVGFNSSNLAWRHVVQAHSKELARPETLQKLGRKPGEIFIEHDVSLIFGLYHPKEDAKLKSPAAFHARKLRIRGNKAQSRFRKLGHSLSLPSISIATTPLPDCPVTSVSSVPGRSIIVSQQHAKVNLHHSPPPDNYSPAKSSNPVKSVFRRPLVGLPGGATWSLSALKAAAPWWTATVSDKTPPSET